MRDGEGHSAVALASKGLTQILQTHIFYFRFFVLPRRSAPPRTFSRAVRKARFDNGRAEKMRVKEF